jgi:hypothetical protein
VWLNSSPQMCQSFTCIKGKKYQLPPNAVKLIRGGSAAVAILDKNGGQAIYAKVNANGTVNEEYILHELIHIATQKALYGTKNIILRAELQNILAAVQKSLAEIKTPGAEHFGKVVNNETRVVCVCVLLATVP